MGLNENTFETIETLILGQWDTIYLVYGLTNGGAGIGRVYMNEADIRTNLNIQNAPNHSVFSNADVIKVGGVFTGELKRIQIYSPAPTGITIGTALCDPASCSVETGYSNPPTCLTPICNTIGSYRSLGTCERKSAPFYES